MRRRLTLLSMRRRCIEFEELINTLSKLSSSSGIACSCRDRDLTPIHLHVVLAVTFFCACILKGRLRVCVSRFDANWIVMATWKFRSIIHRADRDGSRFRAKKNPGASHANIFLLLVICVTRYFQFFRGAARVLDFRERRNDDRNAPSGQTKFRLSLAA